MSTARYRLIALHGFLGSPSDWDMLHASFPEAVWDQVDLWQVLSDGRVADWPSIGAALSARLANSLSDPLPAFVIGYSLGARLALSVPNLGTESPVAGTCLVSCHPGLPEDDDGARAARKAADEEWARRFIDAPVRQVWKEWDAQAVFAGSAVPVRGGSLPGPRVTLARAMRVASLASQPDRRPLLRAWKKPLLWVSGERDAKFRALASSLAAEGVPATFVTCPHAGHRVPFDNPAAFADAVQQWIEGVLT